jgi:hypothetical protein
MLTVAIGLKIMLAPASRAEGHSPSRTARKPPWAETKLLEQAVSNDEHGPCKSSAKETRPTATDIEAEVTAYPL